MSFFHRRRRDRGEGSEGTDGVGSGEAGPTIWRATSARRAMQGIVVSSRLEVLSRCCP